MLSDTDILQAMADGQLAIDPFDKSHLRPAGVSLHLGHEILIPQPVKLIDFRAKTDIPYETHALDDKKPFILNPQQFVLGHTREILTVGPELGFLIEGRSTLARLGVSVEQSATMVDSGHYARTITLEIYNCGPSPVTLYKHMAIGRGVVFRLLSPASRSFDYYGPYASQKKGAGKPILREKSS